MIGRMASSKFSELKAVANSVNKFSQLQFLRLPAVVLSKVRGFGVYRFKVEGLGFRV